MVSGTGGNGKAPAEAMRAEAEMQKARAGDTGLSGASQRCDQFAA